MIFRASSAGRLDSLIGPGGMIVGIFNNAESCGTPPGMADGMTIGIGPGTTVGGPLIGIPG